MMNGHYQPTHERTPTHPLQHHGPSTLYMPGGLLAISAIRSPHSHAVRLDEHSNPEGGVDAKQHRVEHLILNDLLCARRRGERRSAEDVAVLSAREDGGRAASHGTVG